MSYTTPALCGAFKVSPVLHSACTLRVRQRLPRRECRTGLFVCGAHMQEVWKPVPGYEGLYEVSDQGRVRNAQKRILSPNRQTNGYLCVHLYKCGRHTRSPKTIHKLVATAFLMKPEGAVEVNHKNFNRQDNSTSNLEWVTHGENVRHTIASGRRHLPGKPIKGVCVRSGAVVVFNSQIAAERALRGKQTGGISGAMKRGRPAYGFVWGYA